MGSARGGGGTLPLDFSRAAAAAPPARRVVSNPTGSRLSSASSQEVLRQLDRDEEVVFREVHTRIPAGTDRITRLERFQEWMQENRSEVREILDRSAERSLRRVSRRGESAADYAERTMSASARAARARRIAADDSDPF